MRQEDKELLLKDLCARQSYGVKCKICRKGLETYPSQKITFIHYETAIIYFNNVGSVDSSEVKPYLRSMSSMTFEETREFLSIEDNDSGGFLLKTNKQDWLNAHHFDYRGLIEKGLAIEAPKDMYKVK